MRSLLITLFVAALACAASAQEALITGGVPHAIRLDAQSEGTGTTTFSWTHTPVVAPKAVIVFCVANTASTDVFSGATYGAGSEAMTQITSAADTAGEASFVEGYFLNSPADTDGASVTCTVSSGTTAKWGVAFTLNNASASAMESLGSCTASANAANCGCTITPTKAELSFHVFGQANGQDGEVTTAKTSYTMGPTHDFTSQTAHSGYIIRNVARENGPSTGIVAGSDDCANVGIAVGIQ